MVNLVIKLSPMRQILCAFQGAATNLSPRKMSWTFTSTGSAAEMPCVTRSDRVVRVLSAGL